jgi:DNA-binding transcriptional MerR regulator/methylmalonyl-CoA mutase cobalamin-binding subunit
MAGINPTLLRAWERRYHLVSPQRTPTGYRVYSEADIAVLRAAARLCAAGQTIGDVARLPAAELLAAADHLGATELDRGGDARDDDARADADPLSPSTDQIAGALTKALAAIAAFDRQGFETALFPLTTMAGLGPVALCDRVFLPLLRSIGDEWEHGRLTVAAEHFGSGLCRGKILQCLEFVARAATGPRVVCACPEDELHEGGLLAFAVRAAVDQWQVIYLGAHTPIEQALETAVRIAADLVAVSLTVPHGTAHIDRLTSAVAQTRQQRPGLRVLAGGREALARRSQLEAAGIEVAAQIGVALRPPSGSATEKMRPR